MMFHAANLRGRTARGAGLCLILAGVYVLTGTAMAQPARKPTSSAGKSTSITIASPDDEAKAAKHLVLLDNAGPKMEAAKKQSEALGKLADDTTTRYAKAESPVREAADKLIAVYREGKVLHDDLADAYKTSAAVKIEPLQDKIKKNARAYNMQRDAPNIRTIQVANLLEETATREKAGTVAVADIFEKWAASRKVTAETAKALGDLLMSDSSTDPQVDDARDAFTLAQSETAALFTHMRTMAGIRQKQSATGVSNERATQLAQAEQMANQLLAATRAFTVANVKALKLGRQIDASMLEARQAVAEANASPVRPPASRTTSQRTAESVDLSGKPKPPQNNDPKKRH